MTPNKESDRITEGTAPFATKAGDFLTLADWRRQISEIYAATRRQTDPRRAWRKWRQARDRLFHHHPQSPVPLAQRGNGTTVPFFPYDSRWRFAVGLQAAITPKVSQAEGGKDGMILVQAFAQTSGLKAALGQELTIYWITGYGGGLFLPFRDATGGTETYGGGRYILDSIKGADLGTDREGRMIIDFNFAYHPSCYYSNDWICPLAPIENHLEIAIRAGERF